jgi:hypothetical protein
MAGDPSWLAVQNVDRSLPSLLKSGTQIADASSPCGKTFENANANPRADNSIELVFNACPSCLALVVVSPYGSLIGGTLCPPPAGDTQVSQGFSTTVDAPLGSTVLSSSGIQIAELSSP